MKKKAVMLAALLLLVILWAGPGSRDAEAASKYTIYVNRSTNIVNVVRRKSGKVVRSMYCSTGRGYGTPAGTFYIGQKYRWRALFQGHYGQYCSRITGHILFHSVPAVAYRKTAVPTRAFNQLGKQASMGCVRLACGDAFWIYKHCSSGTKVVIGEKRKLKKPKYSPVHMSTKKRNNWDPTDPSTKNPYRPVLRLSKAGKAKIPYGSSVDITKLVNVKSQLTSKTLLMKNIKMKGKINTSKPGKYKVKVTVKDPRTRLSRTKTFKFVVAGKEETQAAMQAKAEADKAAAKAAAEKAAAEKAAQEKAAKAKAASKSATQSASGNQAGETKPATVEAKAASDKTQAAKTETKPAKTKKADKKTGKKTAKKNKKKTSKKKSSKKKADKKKSNKK